MILRIGHLSTFYHTAVLLMAEGTTGKKLGGEPEWRLFGTGPAIIDAFGKGELDLAYVGLPPAISAISRGLSLVCVAGGHVEGTVISGGRDMVGYPEEDDLSVILGQLKGKRIGVPGKGSIHDVIIRDCLERYALATETEVVNLQWADHVTGAMVRGEIAAAVGTPALAVSVSRFAEGKILYPPAKLWPYNPSYGIVVTRDFLKRSRNIVEGFLMLHEEATAFIRHKPVRAAGIISEYIGFIDTQFVLDTFMLSPKYCAQLTDEYIASTREFVPVLKRLGYITREVGSDEIFDASLIRKIHPEKEHYSDGITGYSP